MKKSLIALVTGLVMASFSPFMFAADLTADQQNTQNSSTPGAFEQGREKLKQMTPEQRRAFMKSARAKWEKLTPEERQKFKLQMREKMAIMKKQQAERKMVRIYSLYLLEQQGQQ